MNWRLLLLTTNCKFRNQNVSNRFKGKGKEKINNKIKFKGFNLNNIF